MLKELIQQTIELAKPNIIGFKGFEYTDKDLSIITPPTPKTLTVNTIGSVIEYLNKSTDIETLKNNDFLIHIESHKSVNLYNGLTFEMDRPKLLTAVLNDFSPQFGNWYDLESFIIIMQSRFVQTETTTKILKSIGNITNENITSFTDDGVTQNVAVKKGAALIGKENVPNPVTLQPFRTFIEAEQPESDFVLRIKPSGQEFLISLHEADGGAWINNAVKNIRTYIENNLGDDLLEKITILS